MMNSNCLCTPDEYYQKKRILVTGAAGFIGGHLLRQLHAYGAYVVAVDRVQGEQLPGVQWIVKDLFDLRLEDLETFDVQIVFHLAAVLGVSYAWKYPNQTMTINALGTSYILKLVNHLEVNSICILSSSEVYGEPTVLPIREENQLQPLSIYGWSKVLAEKVIEAYTYDRDICSIVIRPFNVYGPGQRHDFVVSRFLQRAIQNIPPEIINTGKQQRVFTFISDFIDGVLLAMAKNTRGFHVYNLAADEPISIATLADLIIEMTNADVKPKYVSVEDMKRNPEAEIVQRIPSIEKAKRELHHSPKVSLRQGLEITYTYMLDKQQNCQQDSDI